MGWRYLFGIHFGHIRSRPFLGERGCGWMMSTGRSSRGDSLELAGRAGKCR